MPRTLTISNNLMINQRSDELKHTLPDPDRVPASQRYGLYERSPRYGNRHYETELTEYEQYVPRHYDRASREDYQGEILLEKHSFVTYLYLEMIVFEFYYLQILKFLSMDAI